jgi:hypothetical protein
MLHKCETRDSWQVALTVARGKEQRGQLGRKMTPLWTMYGIAGVSMCNHSLGGIMHCSTLPRYPHFVSICICACACHCTLHFEAKHNARPIQCWRAKLFHAAQPAGPASCLRCFGLLQVQPSAVQTSGTLAPARFVRCITLPHSAGLALSFLQTSLVLFTLTSTPPRPPRPPPSAPPHRGLPSPAGRPRRAAPGQTRARPAAAAAARTPRP